MAERRWEKIRSKINSENQNYLLNVNQTEYVDHLINEGQFEDLVLDFERIYASTCERDIPAEHFPFGFFVDEGRSYTKQIVVYHIPFDGDESLLHFVPNPRVMTTHEVWVENDSVCFDVVNFNDDSDQIKSQAKSVVNTIKSQYQHLIENVRSFNDGLKNRTEAAVDNRRGQILKQNDLVASLGVPIKKSTDVPKTFSVPAKAKKKVAPKPSASTAAYKAEPTLELDIYKEILTTIQDSGRVFERLPSTYASKNEEMLRDHLILQLEPRFEGSTTGETFNKKGKTDILLRYQNENIFVAECKFWSGRKKHFEAIDQILSYLTWRDSKAAIIYFVKTKEISKPLNVIEIQTQNHPGFLAAKEKENESWFNYEFHLPGDPARSIQLAVLCFHIPKA